MARYSRLAAWAAALVMLAGAASAQTWPNRRVTLVVPFPPGASSDLVGRLMAERIGAATGQAVVVENRGGAGGTLGTAHVAAAAPDGYTLLLGNLATLVTQPILNPTVRYEPLRDFTPIAMTNEADVFVGVNADLPVNSVAELVAYARAHPGQVNYGSPGLGSSGHFAGEMLRVMAGIDIVHVPYRGSQPAVTDLVGGRIQLMLDPIVVPQSRGGRVRVLASTGSQRFLGTPDLPTARESGLPDYVTTGIFGLLGPAQVPREIVDRLAAIFAEAARDPAWQRSLVNGGLTPAYLGSEAFAERIRSDLELYRAIQRQANIPPLE